MTLPEPPPLQLPRDLAQSLYTALGDLLGQNDGTDWTPPPPGSKRHRLPQHILDMLVLRPYLSTACEMAHACDSAVVRHPDHRYELIHWRDLLHEFCRLNNKYSDVPCICPCKHKRPGKETRA